MGLWRLGLGVMTPIYPSYSAVTWRSLESLATTFWNVGTLNQYSNVVAQLSGLCHVTSCWALCRGHRPSQVCWFFSKTRLYKCFTIKATIKGMQSSCGLKWQKAFNTYTLEILNVLKTVWFSTFELTGVVKELKYGQLFITGMRKGQLSSAGEI